MIWCKYFLKNTTFSCVASLWRLFHTSRFIRKEIPSFITTPIFYVNGAPHIGHYYTAVVADTINRYVQLAYDTENTLFVTGTDEHGLKIQKAAANAGMKCSEYVDAVSSQFQEMCEKGSINHSHFIRTSSNEHKLAVKHFWETLEKKGHIYKGKYEGWYCVPDESFLGNSEVTETKDNGNIKMISNESGHDVEWMSEENYLFKLSSFKDDILHWIGPDDSRIKPVKYARMIRRWLEEDLKDLSVSRPKSRLQWGIDVPGDPDHTVYVWLDALVNYLTAVGYPKEPLAKWPPDRQVIGKDILKFHAVYWPAFLMAAGLEPPRQLLCHSHWIVANEKMSKSRGNVVDPVDRMNRFSVSGLRYFLLARGVPHSDGNYRDDKIALLLNAELGGIVGNLLQRSFSRNLNPEGVFTHCNVEKFEEICGEHGHDIVDAVSRLPGAVDQYISEYSIHKAIQDIVNCLRMCNMFIQNNSPWGWKNNPEKVEDLSTFMYTVYETLRVCGILLQPMLPGMADDMLERLSIPHKERLIKGIECFTALKHNKPAVHQGRKLTFKRTVLFNRIK